MFLGEPLPFTFGLDPGAVNQEVQRTCGWPVGNGDIQTLLAAGQRAKIRHWPIQSGQSSEKQSPGLFSDPPHIQQACKQPCGLPQRQAEPSRGFARSGLKTVRWTVFRAPFTLQRETGLDRGIGKGGVALKAQLRCDGKLGLLAH